MIVGNDVLDLAHRSCRARSDDDRLLDRILDPSERAWLEGLHPSGPWSTPLWALWAAKEAAFKAANKMLERRSHFAPRSLVCNLTLTPLGPEARNGDPLAIRGTVRSSDLPYPVPVRGTSDGEHVHVVASLGLAEGDGRGRVESGIDRIPADTTLEELRRHFTDAEWQGIHSTASAVVRLEVRERLRVLMENPRDPVLPRLEILTSGGPVGRTPPRVLLEGGEVSDWDVSLSHHGRYVAWAIGRRG